MMPNADMNKVYGFEGECKAKHGEMTYKLFADVFTARESSLRHLTSHLHLLPRLRQRLAKTSSISGRVYRSP